MSEHHFTERNFIQVSLFAITNINFIHFGSSYTISTGLLHFSCHGRVKMDRFQEIFTPPALPTSEYNPRENVLHQI